MRSSFVEATAAKSVVPAPSRCIGGEEKRFRNRLFFHQGRDREEAHDATNGVRDDEIGGIAKRRQLLRKRPLERTRSKAFCRSLEKLERKQAQQS